MKDYKLEKPNNNLIGAMFVVNCPNWNEEGWQICTWNGSSFEYSSQSNDDFDSLVDGWIVFDIDKLIL